MLSREINVFIGFNGGIFNRDNTDKHCYTGRTIATHVMCNKYNVIPGQAFKFRL